MMSFLIVGQGAWASVNLQTGAWHWKLNFHGMEVTYNSRSLHHGWWGQGWCSDIEAKIENDKLILCSIPVKDVSPLEKFTAIFHEGKTYIFNSQRKVTKVLSKNINISISWSHDLPTEIKMNDEQFNIRTESGHIIGLHGDSRSFNFNYDKGLLKQSLDQKFSYDHFDNLVLIDGVKKVELSYTSDDRILKVKDSNKCETIYGFDEFKNKNSILLLSKIHRECRNSVPFSITKVVSSEFHITSNKTVELVQTKESYL